MSRRSSQIWGWMAFDWAAQPFQTLILTFVFGPYFASRVAETAVQGQAAWGYVIAAGSILVAVTAPVLGAVVDAQGPRKPWIAGCSLLYVAAAAGLWLAVPGMGDPLTVLALVVVALIGAELAGVPVDSLLPELGARHELGRISGSGWAFGLWGGARVLSRSDDADAGLRQHNARPGSDPGTRRGIRGGRPGGGPVLGAVVCCVHDPFLRVVRGRVAALAEGLRSLKATLTALPSRPSLLA